MTKAHYSSEMARIFWDRINALPQPDQEYLCALMCRLQDMERTLLRLLHDAERRTAQAVNEPGTNSKSAIDWKSLGEDLKAQLVRWGGTLDSRVLTSAGAFTGQELHAFAYLTLKFAETDEDPIVVGIKFSSVGSNIRVQAEIGREQGDVTYYKYVEDVPYDHAAANPALFARAGMDHLTFLCQHASRLWPMLKAELIRTSKQDAGQTLSVGVAKAAPTNKGLPAPKDAEIVEKPCQENSWFYRVKCEDGMILNLRGLGAPMDSPPVGTKGRVVYQRYSGGALWFWETSK